MTIKEGKKIRNILTGRVYEVKRINREWVLLQAEDGLSQVLTGKMGLKFMYACDGAEDDPLNMPGSFHRLAHNAGDVL